MRVLQPSWGLSLKVWWAMTWRILPLALIAGFLMGMVAGIAGQAMAMPTDQTLNLAKILGALAGAVVSVIIIRRLMERGFGNMRLVVVDRYDT